MFMHNSAPGFTHVPVSRASGNPIALAAVLFLAFFLNLGTAAQADDSQNRIMVFGDSLSASYGVQLEESWVSLLEQRLHHGAMGWEVVNESISGETTGEGLRRLPDLLRDIQPDIVVLELGGNDGLRGFPPKIIRANLAKMIELAQESSACVLLVGMRIPPNYGKAYTTAFHDIFQNLADEYQTALVPFFLKGVYNRKNAMQPDGIHPAAIAQEQLLDNVWPELEELLKPEKCATH